MDAAAWDARYATDDYVWRIEPNVFLAREAAGLPPGRALDLACGEGRNAVWLAEQGWTVTGVDFSEVGIGKARRLADQRGVKASFEAHDVLSWSSAETFDLVVVLYLQLPAPERRVALGVAARALAPRGTLLVVAHDSRNLEEGTGGPQHPSVLYGPDDVAADLEAGDLPDLVIVKAVTVERPVEGADRPALDCLVRARLGGPA